MARDKAERQRLTEKAVERKKRIARGTDFSYRWEGYLRKGKVHCSCAMCAAKTNSWVNKSRGPVCEETPHGGTRLRVTNGRYGRKNYSAADRKKVDRMQYMLKEA